MLKILNRLAVAAAVLCAPLVYAQTWPAQPVKMIVGFPPGGTTDVIARLVAQGLSESLGKSFVVDNRGGASGSIGAGLVAKSAPDGYTMLMTSSTHGTAPFLYANLPYQEKDLIPVALVASTPYVFVVHPVVRTHPETGKKALYLGQRIRGFVGFTEDESAPILKFLNQHATSSEFVYRHRWEVDDLVMWDNRCLLHVALPDFDQTKIRHMTRTSVLGELSGRVFEEEGDADRESFLQAIASVS